MFGNFSVVSEMSLRNSRNGEHAQVSGMLCLVPEITLFLGMSQKLPNYLKFKQEVYYVIGNVMPICGVR